MHEGVMGNNSETIGVKEEEERKNNNKKKNLAHLSEVNKLIKKSAIWNKMQAEPDLLS